MILNRIVGTRLKLYIFVSLQIFQGNTNTYIAELREVDPPMIARRVRFLPYSGHPRTICMRVELYGCPWNGKHIIMLGKKG